MQFFFLQIVEGEKWVNRANKQHFFVIREPFIRGSFVSNTNLRKGHPEVLQKFAIDIQKFHLYIDPEGIPQENKEPLAKYLSQFLDLNKEEKENFYACFYRKTRSRKLAMWLEREEKEAILNWWFPFAKKNHIPRNALYFVADYQRSYPFGKLLGQVLHTVQNQKDALTGQAIPTGGLELYFDPYLQGKEGKRRLMRSPLNSLETGEVIAFPEHGADIYLTINHYLQAIVEEELERGVKKSQAKGGWAVLMEPKTGEIWAIGQYPDFSPQEASHYFNDPLLIEHTKVKAITDSYEPGSIIKPITCAIAFLANEELKKRGEPPLFNPEEKISTAQGNFPGRSKPIVDTHLHFFLNMDMAIQHSSNIYMARIAQRICERLGDAWYRKALSLFGFGLKSGIELPGETAGMLPRMGKKHPNGALEWSKSTPYSLAMGYNLRVSSIQILKAFAVLANGGYLVSPTLVKKICKGEKQVDMPLKKPVQILSKKNAKRICLAMQYVTKPGGTARRGDVFGYTEAGKTSTTIKCLEEGGYSPKRRSSHFIGLTPITNPAFVLIVSIDEPRYGFIPGVGVNHSGGVCAAPVFREIAKRCLEYLGISPDDPYGYPSLDPRYQPSAHWLSETRQLQEIYESWNIPKKAGQANKK